jgi:hypothetical protein
MLIAEVASAYYLRMPAGALTQGDIWSGLPSIYRSDRKTLGMVITPRCDFAHDKAPVINYLPLMPFDDYFLFEGGCELMEQELRRAADVVHTRAELLGIEQLLEGGVELS